MIQDLYLVRHGQPHVHGGAGYNVLPGPPLSEQGRAEAAAVAAYLADKGVQQLFASPFERTMQTVGILAEQLGLPVTFAKHVAEMAPGEGFPQVRARVAEFLEGLGDTAFERVAIVSHGSPIREMLFHLSKEKIDLSKHNYLGGNCAPTCGVWHVRRSENCRIFTLCFMPSPAPASV